jgi:hypothetical protein
MATGVASANGTGDRRAARPSLVLAGEANPSITGCIMDESDRTI